MAIKNLRIHVISITVICAVVIVAYHMFGGGSTYSYENAKLQGDHYIQMDSATWGRNCDPYIEEALKDWKPSQNTDVAHAKPHAAALDNALMPLSALCNGKLTCEFYANSKTIGDEPLERCYKKLNIRYRCYTYDPLIIKEVSQGTHVSLDCRPSQPEGSQSEESPHR